MDDPLPMAASKLTKETLEKISVVALASTVILKLPWPSVVVAPLLPFIETVTPANGCLFSAEVTVPVISLPCAKS